MADEFIIAARMAIARTDPDYEMVKALVQDIYKITPEGNVWYTDKWRSNQGKATRLWATNGLPFYKKYFPNWGMNSTVFVINVLEGE